ncbi:hypothetical protein [Leuconostoc mesenteroides]|uniref:ApeA N-terminal domain 1-containing protein n=1 Tax=Leuconostoc mesenteroides TaxID=1245 RepID=UPI0023616439|nr:hypothetical protein [Leuconostoc mesenteroides]
MSEQYSNFNLRSEFEYPVFVSLKSLSAKMLEQNKLPKKDIISGFIKKSKTGTFLILSNSIADKMIEKWFKGLHNEDERLYNEETWFAETWDGALKFTFRLCKFNSSSSSINNFHQSKWEIEDFSISSNFNLENKVSKAAFDLDNAVNWFGIDGALSGFGEVNTNRIPESEMFTDLEFENQKFSLTVLTGFSRKTTEISYEQKLSTTLIVDFEKKQTREFTLELSNQVRNLLQIITNQKIGINRFTLGVEKIGKPISINGGVIGYERDDRRENWFISGTFLPKKEKLTNLEIRYSSVKEDFQTILETWFTCTKIQVLAENYLHSSFYEVPVGTTLVMLISGIDTFFAGQKYKNSKKELSAKSKLQQLIKLTSDWENFFGDNYQFEMEEFSSFLIDNRVYRTHGTKRKSTVYVERELVLPVKRLSKILRKFILYQIGIKL